jgi:hypothetical protein
MKRITNFIQSILSIGALLLACNLTPPVQGAGINQKGLAVELSFEDLVGTQPNFDLRGFTVVDGTLTAFGTVTWSVNRAAVGPLAFELPVTAISGSCDVLSLDIEGMDVDALGIPLSFSQVDFDIHSGEITPNAVRNLLCTAARMADARANAYALAAALNRILPAVQ